MGHNIRGFVAKADALRDIAQRCYHLRTVNLRRGLAFAPLSDECADALTEGMEAPSDGTTTADSAILDGVLLRRVDMRVAADLSKGIRLAYIETDYWGGRGHQCAVGWHDGVVAYPLTYANRPGPINGVLAFLGVKAVLGDRFNAVGLQHFRCMDDFEDQESECYAPHYLERLEAQFGPFHGRIRRWWRSLWH